MTAGGYTEMMEYRSSARGHLIALEDKGALEGYLEEKIQDTTMKQKAYGTLASPEMHAEPIDQLVSLQWRAVVLVHFEEEMRTISKIHALIAVPYVRTGLQLRFAWRMTGLIMDEFDSEEGKIKGREGAFDDKFKRSHDLRRSGSSVCETERRSLFLLIHVRTKILVLALKTCAKILREGNARTKTLILQALLDIHQIKPMRVNLKEPVELEPMKKILEQRSKTYKGVNGSTAEVQ